MSEERRRRVSPGAVLRSVPRLSVMRSLLYFAFVFVGFQLLYWLSTNEFVNYVRHSLTATADNGPRFDALLRLYTLTAVEFAIFLCVPAFFLALSERRVRATGTRWFASIGFAICLAGLMTCLIWLGLSWGADELQTDSTIHALGPGLGWLVAFMSSLLLGIWLLLVPTIAAVEGRGLWSAVRLSAQRIRTGGAIPMLILLVGVLAWWTESTTPPKPPAGEHLSMLEPDELHAAYPASRRWAYLIPLIWGALVAGLYRASGPGPVFEAESIAEEFA